MTTTVLYVAYGSNLHPDRFNCYVSGGTPTGATRTYHGCADPTPHGTAVALHIPHRRFFAGNSRIWNGGAAFIDPEPGEHHRTPAVGYPIAADQLRDIIAQENGGEAGDLNTLELPEPGEHARIATNHWYDLLIGLQVPDGRHGITFTAATPPAPNPNTPSPAYLDTIRTGISIHHG